ncbi:MAG: ABC transporter ATP-binding protein [Acidobacteria bacterium]|nr:MAG: ABC transporter ATP-binding protein [Acidobacteriota bacterium]
MLELLGLSKRFSGIPVVNDVCFVARPSEVVGYLGPNGAGKSTTVKMLTGLLPPSDGEIHYRGENIQKRLIDYKRRVGYVPEEPYLYPYLSGREYLQLVGRLRSIRDKILNEKIDLLLQLFSLFPHRYAAIASYSKGMRQKILIGAALLHNPELLFFDEAESGLDITSALVFRSLVKALASEGKVIFYSSHILEVVEKVCSKIIILHKGRVVANDSVEQLRILMQMPSLEGIFQQLLVQRDPEKTAAEIVELMKL